MTSTLSQITLKTSGSGPLLALLVLVAIAAGYFVYRRTVPPVSPFWRVILGSLRAMSLVLILLLLFDPILSLTRRRQEKPVVAVLVDDSASMSLTDEKGDRRAQTEGLLRDPLFTTPNKARQWQFYTFSHDLDEAAEAPPDSLDLSGDGTDIRRALEALKEQMGERYFGAVVMITDGADNLGENPVRYARNYPVPIYPIAVGDPAAQKDVLVSNFVTNEIAYAGKKIPVDVFIRNNGFAGQRIPVTITHEGRTVDSRTVKLAGNGAEQKARLYFQPEKEGLTKYEIHLPQLAGELTQANNTKVFYAKVLKSKLKVFVVAGAPSPDFSFLKRALGADDNIEVTSYAQKRGGKFYQEGGLPSTARLETFDCFILLDFPHSDSRPDAIDRLRQVFAKGKPALFLAGKNTDYAALWKLRDFLPFAGQPTTGAEHSVIVDMLPQGVYHPVLRVFEDDARNKTSWSQLPPVFSNVASVKLRSGAAALLGIDIARSRGTGLRPTTLLATYDSGKRKSAALLAYGIWRWKLLMQGVGKDDRNYTVFLTNFIHWLTTSDESKLVRVTPNKEIYRSGEEVAFTAQVYSENYQPLDGAEVTVQLSGSGLVEDLTLKNIGDGRYEGGFQVLDGGDYRFTGTAHQQGRVLGRDSGKFSVEPFSLEFQNTRMNETLLRGIAAASGGEFFTAGDFSGLKQKLRFPEKYLMLNSEWQLWTQTSVLFVGLLLLSVEWLIRKRKGMI